MNHADLNSVTMPPRHDWNRLGPHMPAWYRMKLERIDPNYVLQFIPAREESDVVQPHERGMLDPRVNPGGGWQVCKKLPRSGWLHRMVVFSLVDRVGNPVPPNEEQLAVIRLAKQTHRQGEFKKMQDALDDSIQRIHKEKAAKSRAKLQDAICQFLSIQGDRQFTNRAFIGRPLSDYEERSRRIQTV